MEGEREKSKEGKWRGEAEERDCILAEDNNYFHINTNMYICNHYFK